MMRTTAEASNTRLAISAGTVLADPLLRRGIKGPLALLVCQSLKVGEGLAASLAGIAAAGLLQVTEGQFAAVSVGSGGSPLQEAYGLRGWRHQMWCGVGAAGLGPQAVAARSAGAWTVSGQGPQEVAA